MLEGKVDLMKVYQPII